MGRFQGIFDWLNPVFDSLGVTAGGHLKLPLHNDAVTPTLSFGDGDTGLYESVDDHINISIGGNSVWEIINTHFYSTTAFGCAIAAGAASDTYPVHTFSDDSNTGIGRAAEDSLSLISGSVEGLRLTESAGAVSASGAVINSINGISQLVAAPAASNSTGTAGQIAYDNTYFYVCIASSTWERVELASW